MTNKLDDFQLIPAL